MALIVSPIVCVALAQGAAPKDSTAPKDTSAQKNAAGQKNAGKPIAAAVTYDHNTCAPPGPCRVRFHANLADGESFSFVIANTDSNRFTYTVETIEQAQAGPLLQELQGETDRDTVVRTRGHDKRYSGYVLHVTKKTDVTSKLGSAEITLDVTTNAWNVGFGGGFTFSNLTDPAYAVVTDSVPSKSGGTKVAVQRFVRQKSREDEAALGVGSFVHVWHSTVPVAITFGLGINQNRSPTYYIGPSVRLGDQAALTIGPVFGSVKTTPAGISENQIVTDPNATNNLGSRTRLGVFLGLSYSFISGADKTLGKFVLGQNAPTVNTSAPTTTTPEQTPKPVTVSAAAVTPPTTAKVGVPQALTVKYTSTGKISDVTCNWKVLEAAQRDAAKFTPDNPSKTDANGQCTASVTFTSAGKFTVDLSTDDGASNRAEVQIPLTVSQ